ncbi:hypothetical protein GA0070617_1189 [Micromonospora yangpuensis]|uniref:Uncharacterized protein n=2 Tax=Micromonosporaceae TaxID=28056 RepID=A0A1C6U6A4_9ACTN|nr:hypothetical protein GA0070617_1189 [Micromonospora yangpuensis]
MRWAGPPGTSDMTPEQIATASRAVVLALGDAYNRDAGTLRRARLLGISVWAFRVTGWAGPLGDVSAGTVTAALGLVAPDAVAEGWETATRTVRPVEVAAVSLAECCRWGDERLTALPGVDRLAALLVRVVAAADATGMPLFAAWRAMPVPRDTPGARAAVGLRLLREHILGGYLIASRASGLSPLEALLAGGRGEADAIACGWLPPYPPVGPLIRRQLRAEMVTDRLISTAFRALSSREGIELVRLLNEARRHLTEPEVRRHLTGPGDRRQPD